MAGRANYRDSTKVATLYYQNYYIERVRRRPCALDGLHCPGSLLDYLQVLQVLQVCQVSGAVGAGQRQM